MWINVLTAKKPFHSAERCWILHPELKKQINQINGVDSCMVSGWLILDLRLTLQESYLEYLEKTNLMIATADGENVSTSKLKTVDSVINIVQEYCRGVRCTGALTAAWPKNALQLRTRIQGLRWVLLIVSQTFFSK